VRWKGDYRGGEEKDLIGKHRFQETTWVHDARPGHLIGKRQQITVSGNEHVCFGFDGSGKYLTVIFVL